MANLDNAAAAAAIAAVFDDLANGAVTEAQAASSLLATFNAWYTLPTAYAEQIAGFLLSIGGFIVTTGAPSDAVGLDGEFALDNTNGQLYGPKAGGAWGSAILTLGGEDGADGRTILSGTGAPGAGVGSDGDFYYDTAAKVFYGPKASGAWPAGVPLVGPKGDTGELSVGTVTTLAPGESATVTNSGTSTDAVLDFGIPAGAAATVSVGTVSALAPGSTPTVTNSGSTAAAVLNFGLVSGAAATIAVGTVSTGAAGASATVTNTGTSGAAVFDFVIPKGDKGDPGDTGPQGTVADSFAGAWDGATAYAADDIVTYQGETWLALQGSTGSTPVEGATWTKLAAKGADGEGAGTVTSVAITGSDGIEIDSGSPITSSGTIALGVNAAALRTHINVEDGADVTDAANVAAAGARMTGTAIPLADLEQNGATDGQVLTWNDAAGTYEPQDATGGGGGVTVAAIQTAAFTPIVGNAYPVQGGVTLSGLPAAPVQGDRFELHDPNRSWGAGAPVTIPGRINGRSENQIITLTGARVTFEYVDTEWGWEMKVLEPKARFAYSAPFVNTPVISAPIDGATDVFDDPTITTDAFVVVNGSDMHAVTDWQIASDSAFTAVVVQSLDDASNLTSWTVPAGNLATSTTYYVRVRHSGVTYGDSEWSNPISFTTTASFENYPEATGGTVIEDGDYKVHIFDASDTFVVTKAAVNKTPEWEAIIIAAGGAGSSGSGGAGEMIEWSGFDLTAGSYPVVVGAAVGNSSGGSSSFNGNSANGGGRGAVINSGAFSGGSGGGGGDGWGGAGSVKTGTAGTSYGTAGSNVQSGGDGGGAGGLGQGRSNSITGTAIVYATGGRHGSTYTPTNPGDGGGRVSNLSARNGRVAIRYRFRDPA